MQSFGSDRVRVGSDGTIVLLSRLDKRWVPRREKTLSHAEFPGTAVEWEEQHFEVIDAAPLPQGGVQYTLATWKAEHAIRLLDVYDAESEVQRLAAHRADIAREKKRIGVNAAALLTGHLPAAVQEHLAGDLGVNAARLTLISLIGPLVLVGIVIHLFVASRLAQTASPIPLWLWAVCIYLMAESTVRFGTTMSQGRPAGSLFGLAVYLVYHLLAPNRAARVTPFASRKGDALFHTDAPPDVAMQDAFILREPIVTLLSAGEQARIAARFPYDYRHQSGLVAGIILVFAAIGVATSWQAMRADHSLSAALSFLVALSLSVEQVVRLVRFQHGPAGSILGVLARPLVGKLLA